MGVWRGWANALENEVLISGLKWGSAGAVDGESGPVWVFWGDREGFYTRDNGDRLRNIELAVIDESVTPTPYIR